MASGASLFLRKVISSRVDSVVLVRFFYIVAFMIVVAAVSFPLGWFRGYYLERRFGFMRQSFSSWLVDYIKHSLLSLIVAVLAGEILYGLLDFSPFYWWLYFGLFWLLFTFFLSYLTPLLLIPLFFKYLPLEDKGLEERLKTLLASGGFPITRIQRIDFSRKTSKANAFICGLRKKRIVLSDTLTSQFTPEEIEAVVAHELGHYRYQDLLRFILLQSAFLCITFFVASLIVGRVLKGTGIGGLGDIAGLPLLSLLILGGEAIFAPFFRAFSRYREGRADRYSLDLTGEPAAFIRVMEKLGRTNLADPSPSPWIEVLFYDHPPIAKRIALARSLSERK
jgi:STE24 endopeptidase